MVASTARLNARNVITSYSIHYTKLYELCEVWGGYLQEAGVPVQQLSRVWLQQANLHIHQALAVALTDEFSIV